MYKSVRVYLLARRKRYQRDNLVCQSQPMIRSTVVLSHTGARRCAIAQGRRNEEKKFVERMTYG